MSAFADQNHAPSLTCVRLEYFVKLAEIVYNKFQVIQRREGIKLMKIAVTYENGMVFQHFGHSEQFKIYEVEDGKIIASEIGRAHV